MSKEYNQFFNKARKANGPSKGSKKVKAKSKKTVPPKSTKKNIESAEDYLRMALKIKEGQKAKRAPFPLVAALILGIGLVGATYGYLDPEGVDKLLSRIDIRFLGKAIAADEKKDKEKTAETKGGDPAGTASNSKGEGEKDCKVIKAFTEEELSHFNTLNERSQELDLREKELSVLEEELHKQKREIEGRMLVLEKVRQDVAGVLQERVEVDQERVKKLVDFYSNMKPKNAAEVFSTLNEDLAVEVLGKMKKKNAADILNLVEPAKAQRLSEKYAGYKRK